MRLNLAQLSLACFALLACSATCRAQITSSEAQRLGLEIAWSSQLQVPVDGRGIVSAELWTDIKTPPREYAVVELGDRTIRVPSDTRDRRGNPIGMQEAKKQAGQRAARLLGKTSGFEVVEVKVPHVKLVALTKAGLVQTFDAETGNLLWETPCGLSRAPSYPAALSSAGVSVIHGEGLSLLDWETGKPLTTKRLRTATSNAISVSNDVAFVGDFNGRVHAYGLLEEIRPWAYVVTGRAIGQPVALADQSFTAIATDEGYVYVFTFRESPAVWIRYQAPGRIIGSLATGNGAFYVGSDRGTLAKVTTEDRMGRVEWEFRTGQAIASPAYVSGNVVFVATEAGDLIAVDDKTAMTKWVLNSSRAVSIIGRAGNQIFYTTTAGEIAAVDVATGRILGNSLPQQLSVPIINSVNDRIYILSSTGVLQCLRPSGAVLPTFHAPSTTIAEPPAEEVKVSPVIEPDSSGSPFEGVGSGAASPDSVNPFGGGDPFGGGATGAGATGSKEADPFGGDPFGGQ